MAHPVKDLPLEPLFYSMLERLWLNLALRTHMPQRDEQGHPVDTPELDAIEAHDRKGLAELQRDFDRAPLSASEEWPMLMGPGPRESTQGWQGECAWTGLARGVCMYKVCENQLCKHRGLQPTAECLLCPACATWAVPALPNAGK